MLKQNVLYFLKVFHSVVYSHSALCIQRQFCIKSTMQPIRIITEQRNQIATRHKQTYIYAEAATEVSEANMRSLQKRQHH